MSKKVAYSACLALVALVLSSVASGADPNLVGWWKFDGDALDSSGNGRHGTLHGAPAFVAGVDNQALEFFGGPDYVTIDGYDGVLGTRPRSITCWIKTTNSAVQQIIYYGTHIGGQRVAFRVHGDRLRFANGNGNAQGDTAVTDGEWHHVAVTLPENSLIDSARFYLDGQPDTRSRSDADSLFNTVADWDVTIGYRISQDDRAFIGLMDEVRMYDKVLTQAEVEELAKRAKSYDPSPADGTIHEALFAALSWEPGGYAVLHDVYFGDNYDDVDAGTPDTLKGRQGGEFYYVSTLELATTYYWRIDDVEIDGTTIHRGDIWSFTVPDETAYEPSPVDDTKFVLTNVQLSWSPGMGAIFHDVYFGTDESQVTDGTGDTFKGQQPGTTYTPGALDFDTLYYWRIDEVEVDMTTVHPGDVWNFRTVPQITVTDPNLVCWWTFDEGEGTNVLDWSGHGHHGTFRGDPQWVNGYDGYALELDGVDDWVVHSFATETWAAYTVAFWVKANTVGQDQWSSPFSNHVPNSDGFQIDTDGANPGDYRMSGVNADGVFGPVTTEWTHLAATCDGASTNLYYNGYLATSIAAADLGFNKFSVGINRNEGNWFDGAVDILRIYDKLLTQAEIKQAMRGDPLAAWDPSPPQAATVDIDEATPLTWAPGDEAAKHDVYFGADRTAVENADTTTTGIYRGRQDPTSYTPPEGVEFSQTYYWRIDEFNSDATITPGRVWSFTVADYLIVDDFEDYNDYTNRIYHTWLDYFSNNSGATVGYLDPTYVETTIVHEGGQAMPYRYDHDGTVNEGTDYETTGTHYYSEAERIFDPAQDWTRHGVKALTLWFRGNPGSFSSFTEGPAGTYTMTARCGNIGGTADEFHFVYKQLSGIGSIEAKVQSVTLTANDAKAGVMIRDTLEPGSINVFSFFRPDGGVRFNRRTETDGDTAGFNPGTTHTAPHWVRLERAGGNTIRAYHSTDGSNWEQLDEPQIIAMNTDVYVGLALCSQNLNTTCVATFSDVTTTGTVTGAWQSQEIGIQSNTAEQLYVALEDSTGTSKVVEHEDPDALLLDTWQEWNIDMKEFSDAGVSLQSIKKMYIGVGDRLAPQAGGAGLLYIDDVRLYRPRCLPDLARPAGDFSDNCVVDYPDLEILSNNWLMTDYEVTPMAASDANLVAHYKLDGNANDSSGNGYHGDPSGGPTYVTGMDNQAISLDGLDDYLAIQNFNYASTGHTEVSVCAWIRTSHSYNQTIASFDRSEYWRFELNGNGGGPGQVGWSVMSNMGAMDYGSDSRVDDSQWHHIAGTFDNGTIAIYIDGNREALGDGGQTFGTGITRYGFVGSRSEADVFDGSRSNNPWLFEGELDDVRIYSRALSQAEVASLAGKTSPFTQPLHLLMTPADPAIDMDSSGTIDLKDYALLVEAWIDEILWP